MEGATLYLVELKIRGSNQLTSAEDVAMVIPTPSVLESDQVIYSTGTRQFVINGTNFNPKRTDLIFDPPLIRNQDYLLNVATKVPAKPEGPSRPCPSRSLVHCFARSLGKCAHALGTFPAPASAPAHTHSLSHLRVRPRALLPCGPRCSAHLARPPPPTPRTRWC